MHTKDPLFYERFAIGDYDTAQMAEYARNLNEDDKKLIEDIRKRNAIFYQKHPYWTVHTKFKPYLTQASVPKKENPKSLFSFLRVAVPLLACFILVFVSLRIFSPSHGNLSIKGEVDTFLVIYKQTPEGAIKLYDTDIANTGDLLQIAYAVAEPCYGAIISMDSRRNVTNHLPLDSMEVQKLEQSNSEILLPYACRLDDAPKFELFLLITSDKPFSLSKTTTIIQTTNNPLEADLEGLTGLSIEKFLLQKGR